MRLGEPVEGLERQRVAGRRLVGAHVGRARGARLTAASSPKVMPRESVESRLSSPFGSSVTTLTSPSTRK